MEQQGTPGQEIPPLDLEAPKPQPVDEYLEGPLGFYHPDRGYWQTTDGIFQSRVDTYPEGTTKVPLRPDEFHEWDAAAKKWVLASGWQANLQTHNQARIDRAHEVFLEQATGFATTAEQITWRPKEAAARAYDAGTATAAQTAMLEAEAAGDGSDVADLVARIILMADAFMLLAGDAAGIRQGARNDLAAAIDAGDDKATTLAAIDGVMTSMDGKYAAALAALSG